MRVPRTDCVDWSDQESSIPEFQSDLLESSARASEVGWMINLVAGLDLLLQSQQSVQVMILTSQPAIELMGDGGISKTVDFMR